MLSRRDVLQWLGSAALLASTRLAAEPAAIKARRLAANAYLLTGAGCNVLMVMGVGGIALVDGGLAENADALLQTVAHLPGGGGVRVVINTHGHAENTGANAVVLKAGGRVIARAEGELTIGAERLEYAKLPNGHTDSDLYVCLRTANILMAGDVVAAGSYPVIDVAAGGSLRALVRASKTLMVVANAETRVIPAQGPMQSKADLQAQYDMLATVQDRLLKSVKQGMSAQEAMAAAPTKEFDAQWGDPKLFLASAYASLKKRQ